MKVRATLDVPAVYSQVYPTYPFADIFRYVSTPCDMYTDWHLSVDICLQYREWSSSLSTLQQLGVTNPLLLAWELVPYSFIADWFIPVGDYLQSLDRFLGKEFVKGCISKTIQTTSRTKLKALRSTNYWYTFELKSCPESLYRIRFHNRTPYSSFPSTSLPTIDVNLNCSRMVDALSLLKQRSTLATKFGK